MGITWAYHVTSIDFSMCTPPTGESERSSIKIEKRLARTYNTPSYDDPYDVVRDYRRVQRAAANHPNKGSSALSNIVELPRGRIRGWIDDDADSMPDAVRAISVAQNKGWLDPTGDTAVALAAIVGHLLGGGSIAKQNYVPSISEGRRVPIPEIKRAFRRVGVRSDTRHEMSENRATEVVPAEYSSILGRTLTAWGCPVGGRSEIQSLPRLLDHTDDARLEALLKPYVLHRSVNYTKKATSRLQGDQPERFHKAIAELIEEVTGETATYASGGVTVSAAAMRALGLDE